MSLQKWMASFLLKCFYNIYFHPLSRYPGPRLWSATYLTYWYYAFQGRANHEVRRLHQQYGEVVRIAPWRLSFTNADAWEDIYGFSVNPMLEKDPIFYTVFREKGIPRGINNAEGAYHARLRKQLSYAFSEKALREQEPLIKSHIDLMIRKLGNAARLGTIVDMVNWYTFTTFDGKLIQFFILFSYYYHLLF